MPEFCYLNKQEKDRWLPCLFDLFYENMSPVIPSMQPFEREREHWLAEVSPALDREPRQIILCFVGGELAGYVQYYVRNQMLMVEEMQLARKFHRTGLFGSLCRYLSSTLPEKVQTVEAFAHRHNTVSVRLMERLGMGVCGEDPRFLHLRGLAEDIRLCFGLPTAIKKTASE